VRYDADPGLWFDIEHDDHAHVSIMSDAAVALIETFYPGDDRVSGVVQTWQSRSVVYSSMTWVLALNCEKDTAGRRLS
jgi:hypothetical protein